jgi:hypothetical protein
VYGELMVCVFIGGVKMEALGECEVVEWALVIAWSTARRLKFVVVFRISDVNAVPTGPYTRSGVTVLRSSS